MDVDIPTDKVLNELLVTIESRRADLSEDSYMTTFFTHEKDENYVLKRLGEKMTETIPVVKDNDDEGLLYESASLIHHLLVLLSMKDTSLDGLRDELKARF